jgi:hypothetical protein
MSKVTLLFTLISLSACNVNKHVDNGPVCTEYAGAFQVQYPDGTFKKSGIKVCDTSYYVATTVDHTQTITADVLYVQLRDNLGNLQIQQFTPAIGDICVSDPSHCQ